MIDGVEENDVWLNWAYLSRQYPISNIKAIEVVYGPTGTMYGPRAFVGAINIITFPPRGAGRRFFQAEGEQKLRPLYQYKCWSKDHLTLKTLTLLLVIQWPKVKLNIN